MFAIEQPAMALNDSRLKSYFAMQINRLIQPDESVSQILGYVVNEAKKQPGGKLKNLIFNCHATPGILEMGIGIDRTLTNRFSMLVTPEGKPMVDMIYLSACSIARIDGPGSATDGNLFCCEVAKNAKCQVVASTAKQTTGLKYVPYGMMDKWEGTVLVYGPKGNVLSSATHPMFSRWSSARD